MSEAVISTRDLCKSYRVYNRPFDRVREWLIRRPLHERFEALTGVSFDIARGEGFGIIGQNGAGKSTLLKILSGVTTQTSGDVQVRGKVASLLELGSAFHPELTGRQNIQLNAAMLGLSQPEVDQKLPEIIAFSELGNFIDQPVKCYSTGMAMRLGFSIATQVQPEVLIIDEALSVGDGYFQKKCMDRLQLYLENGGTLLLCSHAMYYVTAFCRRALWLRHGKIEDLGPSEEVVRRYENFLLDKAKGEQVEHSGAPAEGGQPARLIEARLEPSQVPGTGIDTGTDIDGLQTFQHQDSWALEIEWETEHPEVPCHLAVGLDRIDGVQVASFSTFHDGLPSFQGQARQRQRLYLPQLPFLKGEFTVYVYLMDEKALHPYDLRILHRAFGVATDNGYRVGLVDVAHDWQAALAANSAEASTALAADSRSQRKA